MKVINMKKYLSVLYLYIRSNIYKLITIISIMAFTQVLMFKNVLKTIIIDTSLETGLLGIERYIEKSNIILVFGISFLILTAFLIISGCDSGSKQGYTLRRLRITEKKILICQTISNSLFYTVFLLSEVITVFIMCRMYMNFAAETNTIEATQINHQTIFLAFYRSDFLHSLLPLDDIIWHITNLLTILTFGFTAAVFPYFLRRKRISLELFILIPFTLIYFTSAEPLYLIGACCILGGIAIARFGSEAKIYE